MTATESVQLDLLGPMRIRVGGHPVDVPSPRLRTLLVRLALDVGRVVSADRLIDDLWPDGPPAGALGSLRSYLSQLRTHLGSQALPGDVLIATHGRGYALEVPPEALDTVRFQQLLAAAAAAARNGDAAAALAAYAEALAFWHGEALADVRDEPFAQPEITRLEEQRLAALEDRCDVLLQAGSHREAVPELEALVAANPHRERPRAQLMLALYRSGRSADALRVHREYRSALADELGLDPGPDIDRLADDILRQDPRLLARPAAQSDGVRTRTATTVAEPTPVSRVVGRSGEREVLATAVRHAVAGAGRCVLLAGEPGIGKTALLEEMAGTAASAGLPVHWGRCREAAGAPALWPWREVVRSILGGLDTTGAEAVTSGPAIAVLRLLDAASPSDGSDRPQDVDQARFALYQAVVGLVEQTAPNMVVLDDIHWADPYSLQLLGELAARVSGRPIIVAVSYRDVAPHGSPDLLATLATMSRQAGTQLLELSGLDEHDVTEMLEATTGTPPSADAVAHVMHRTAGNPFFIQQLASLQVDDGEELDAGATSVPAGVRHVIDQRAGLLGADVRATLEAAAVLGRDFHLPVVAAVTSQDLDVVLDHADRAVGHGLAVADAGGALGYRFVHSLVRETLYELVPPARRLRLHAAAASVLDDQHAAPAEQIAEHHLAAAGLLDPARVVTALRRAAEAARGVLAYDQAEVYLRQALDVLERDGGSDPRIELVTRLELVKIMTSRRGWTDTEVEDVAGRVREIVDEAGIGLDLIPLWWALWNHYFTRGDLETADELAGKLLDDAESHDSPACRVAGRVAAATMGLHRRADTDAALAHLAAAREAEAAAPAARLAVTPEHLSVVLRTTEATALALARQPVAAESSATEAMEYAKALGNPFAQAFAGLHAGLVAALGDAPERARTLADAALALCEAHGFDDLADVIAPLHAWARGRLDDDSEAERGRAAAAIDVLRQRQHHHLLPQWLLLLADLERRAGASDAASGHVAEAQQLVGASGDFTHWARLAGP